MNKDELNSYRREYNKTTYKTVKVYIPIDEYDGIIDHMKSNGYDKLSGYIKALIDADMNK
jgi:hypothetical protein